MGLWDKVATPKYVSEGAVLPLSNISLQFSASLYVIIPT